MRLGPQIWNAVQTFSDRCLSGGSMMLLPVLEDWDASRESVLMLLLPTKPPCWCNGGEKIRRCGDQLNPFHQGTHTPQLIRQRERASVSVNCRPSPIMFSTETATTCYIEVEDVTPITISKNWTSGNRSVSLAVTSTEFSYPKDYSPFYRHASHGRHLRRCHREARGKAPPSPLWTHRLPLGSSLHHMCQRVGDR